MKSEKEIFNEARSLPHIDNRMIPHKKFMDVYLSYCGIQLASCHIPAKRNGSLDHAKASYGVDSSGIKLLWDRYSINLLGE